MNTKSFAVPSLALAAVLALAGCGAPSTGSTPATSPSGTSQMGHGGHSMPMGTPTGSSSQGAFNAADVMFAQMMIPHHEQAVEMSDIVLGKPGLDPRVAALAQQIKAAQAPEIATLRGWLTAWGHPSMMPSDAGHAMEGMLSADDLAKLRAADPAEAAKMFLTQMVAHHEGAVSMAEQELGTGANADAVALAQSIVTSQKKEIDQMKALVAQL